MAARRRSTKMPKSPPEAVTDGTSKTSAEPRELDFETEVYPRFFPAVEVVARQFAQAARARLWAVEDDDALSIAREALWTAYKKDPTCGPGFSNLAKTITHYRLINWLKREVPIIRGVGGGDGGPPAQVYSLDYLQEREPELWESQISELNDLFHGEWMMPSLLQKSQKSGRSGRKKKR